MSFFDISDSVKKWFTGDSTSNEQKNADKAYQNALNVKNKSTAELQQEGREGASQAAADKAGQAKKQAKAAAMQTNGNKLQASNAAASSAVQAGSEGYDTTANNLTNVAMNQDNQQANAERNAYLTQAQGYEGRANTINQNSENTKKLLLGGATQLGVAGLGAVSDENKKKTKHTYIPIEKRVNKGGCK